MLTTSLLRTFKRAKQYYLTTIFTLALSLSMVLSVFSMVDLVFFAPLPYAQEDNLYLLEGNVKAQGYEGVATNSQIIEHINKHNLVFTEVATYHQWADYKLYDQAKRPEVQVILASSNLFSLLGVEAYLGRLFNQTEALGQKQASVVLGYRIWQQRYQGDKNIIGKKIQLNQRRFTVIGVVPDDLVLPEYADINEAIWLPMDMDERFDPKTAGGFMGAYKGVVRLNNGQADLTMVGEQLNRLAVEGAQLYSPGVLSEFEVGAQITTFNDALRGDSAGIVLMLLAGVSLLMVIALINLSSMQLARAVAKVKTVAISFAFGASRRQLLAESFKHNVAVIGLAVILALLLSSMSFSVIETLAAGAIARLDTLHIGFNTLLFSLFLAILIALLYSAIELSVVKEQQLTNSLQSSGKGVGKQMATGTSHLLIGLQVMFSFVVLAATAHVLLLTLAEALRDNGINTENKWSLMVNYAHIEKKDERINIHQSLVSQLAKLTAVEHLELSSEPRLPQSLNVNQIYDHHNRYVAQTRKIAIGNGYFETLGLGIFGEDFKPGDSELENYPLIVNQRLADFISQNKDEVIGRKFSMDGKTFHPVIGIAQNTYVPGNAAEETYEVYVPQDYSGRREYSFLLGVADSARLEMQVRALVEKVDRRLDITRLSPLDELFESKRERHLFASWVALALAVVSLLMVCIGINGIVNYMVQVKRYDLGVKLAMGAGKGRLLKDSLLELMQPVSMSLIFAFSLSFMLTGYANSRGDISFEPDWYLIAMIWFGFLWVALLVSFFPVQQILNGDPIKALRNE